MGGFAPLSASVGYGTLTIDTTYPFDDTVTFIFNTTREAPLHIRIPIWAHSATLSYNGETLSPAPQNGTMYTVDCVTGVNTLVLSLNPVIRVEQVL